MPLCLYVSPFSFSHRGTETQRSEESPAKCAEKWGNRRRRRKEVTPPEPPGPYTVTWTITATKVGTSDAHLTVVGSLVITNGGSADAPIGNIVVNVQRWRLVSGRKRLVSASVDMADATLGDAATTANIVAAASTEIRPGTPCGTHRPPIRSLFQRGTFLENAGSGTLEFVHMADGAPWLLTDPQVIIPGQTVNLSFKARFHNALLGIRVGESVRVEVIVSFGKAGPSAGVGSARSIDIKGNGAIDVYEDWVRSVARDERLNIARVVICNDKVIFSEDPASLILQWVVGLIDRFPVDPTRIKPDYPPAGDVNDAGRLGTLQQSYDGEQA